MKKLLAVMVAVALSVISLFTFAGCGKDDVVDVTPNQVTVGYTVYSPMNYTDDNGVFCGFDTELALRVFNALGYEVKFREIDWANKYVELNNDTVDCVWNGFTRNSTDKNNAGVEVSREELCDFSIDYMVNGQVLIAKSQNVITDLASLAGKSLAYETNSAADALINGEKSAFKNINVNKSNLPYQINAAEQVMNGSKDYAVIDVILAKDLLENNPSYSDVRICDIDLGVEYYAIAFKTGSELTAKVNIMLKAFAETGYLTELAKKYGVENSLITNWN